MVSIVHSWFQSEVFFWRSLAGILWSALTIPIILLIFSTLSSFCLVHPLQWLWATLTAPFVVTFWFTAVVIIICLVMVTCFSLSHFSVVADINATPLGAFFTLFHWSRLPLLIVSSTASIITAWVLTKVIGNEYGSLTQVWMKNKLEYYQILNEHHLVLVCAGFFAGLLAHWQFFHANQCYLQFSHVQRFKLFRIRSELFDLLVTNFWRSLQVIKYFLILYFFLGGCLKNWISSSFNIQISTELTQLNSLLGMFNISLLWQTYLVIFFISFSWSCARLIIRIFLTDHMDFVICSVLEQEKDQSLLLALACISSPLLQHLAFLDLDNLARLSESRRQEILSLSQPGGHPRIWASVSTSALSSIKELADKIREENGLFMSRVTTQKAYGQASYTSGGNNLNSDEEELKLSQIISKLFSYLSSLPFVSYLLAEYPDAKSRSIFASCQLQIWAVEALSQLASKAITEDKYGVVQCNLPEIIAVLLDLYEVTEKHFKLSSSSLRKYNGMNENLPGAMVRFKLHSTTKAALYSLVITYRQYLEDIRLHPDYFKKLKPFIDFLV